MSSPVVDSYLDELLADLPLAATGEQAAAEHVASEMVTPAPATAPDVQLDTPQPAPAPTPAPTPAPLAPAPAPASTPAPAPAPRAEPRPAAPAQGASGAAPGWGGFAQEPAPATHRPAAPTTQRWLRIALGRDHYAFELLRVQEVVRMAPIVAMRGADRAVLGVMNLRGRIVPVFDLGRWLGGADVQVGERARIVVVERDDELIGVLVADVEDVASLGREHIEPPLPGSAGGMDDVIVGIARVGRVPTVLLDANALFE